MCYKKLIHGLNLSFIPFLLGWGFDYTDPGGFYSDFRWPHLDGCWNEKESGGKGKKKHKANY